MMKVTEPRYEIPACPHFSQKVIPALYEQAKTAVVQVFYFLFFFYFIYRFYLLYLIKKGLKKCKQIVKKKFIVINNLQFNVCISFPYCTENEPNRDFKTEVRTEP